MGAVTYALPTGVGHWYLLATLSTLQRHHHEDDNGFLQLGAGEIGGGDRALTVPRRLPSRRLERFDLRARL
jgi:hypothetical protein